MAGGIELSNVSALVTYFRRQSRTLNNPYARLFSSLRSELPTVETIDGYNDARAQPRASRKPRPREGSWLLFGPKSLLSSRFEPVAARESEYPPERGPASEMPF